MGFNEEELKEIESATSGWFKKSARKEITKAITGLRESISSAQKLPEEEKRDALKQLASQALQERHRAMESGATSSGHPKWAAAAVCESWLLELISGTDESIARVEAIIDRLEKR